MNGSVLELAVAAQEAAPGGGADASFFIMMGAIFAIFYFLVLRPQQKKQRALEEAVKSAVKGDHVITAGGLHGRIVASDEDVLTLEIATVKGQPVRVQVARGRIEAVTRKDAARDETGGEKSDKDKKEDRKGGDS